MGQRILEGANMGQIQVSVSFAMRIPHELIAVRADETDPESD
jgi:hypothetical protein